MNEEYTRKVAKYLKDHLSEIVEYFDKEQKKYLELLNRDQDFVGRVIKCHLILEYYINLFIKHHYDKTEIIEKGKLSFYQKIFLIPKNKFVFPYLFEGIKELNSIRNKLAHNLNYMVVDSDISNMSKLVQLFNKSSSEQINDLILIIEKFTAIASNFLVVQPEDIQKIFNHAFNFGKEGVN